METENILEQILGKLEKIPIERFAFRCAKFDLVFYIGLGELWIKRHQYTDLLTGLRIDMPFSRMLAKFENGKLIESKSDIELAEILEEMKKYKSDVL